MFDKIIDFVKTLYPNEKFVPLHAPLFNGNENKYVQECIESTFVSSVGEFVNKFEQAICDYTGAKYAVATTNGSSALHVALLMAGVKYDTEVITQALTFVATGNSIAQMGAHPIFLDSAKNNLGLCPEDLENFLKNKTNFINGKLINKTTGREIAACVPMHVFGNPVDMDVICKVCEKYNLPIIEDAAESLGSFYKGQHSGLKGVVGVLSFNGNKIITTGGGGMIITNDEKLAKRAKHITTTAKIPHAWEFYHDEIAFNYRLPNLNAALGYAQMEQLPKFVANKRETAKLYKEFFDKAGIEFLSESKGSQSNYWLNAIKLKNRAERDEFLEFTNKNGVMTRPLWTLMSELPAFKKCERSILSHATDYYNTIVNIPSSVRRES